MADYKTVCGTMISAMTGFSYCYGLFEERFEFVAIAAALAFCMALLLLFENLEG